MTGLVHFRAIVERLHDRGVQRFWFSAVAAPEGGLFKIRGAGKILDAGAPRMRDFPKDTHTMREVREVDCQALTQRACEAVFRDACIDIVFAEVMTGIDTAEHRNRYGDQYEAHLAEIYQIRMTAYSFEVVEP